MITKNAFQALSDWWFDQTEKEMAVAIPKADVYGSRDLIEIGRVMGSLMNPDATLTDEEAVEIGIFFYVHGKLARWTAALREGRKASDDTLLDLSCYLKMAQRNREVGGWPFGPNPDEREVSAEDD